MAFTATPTAGVYNVWIPPAHLGNIATTAGIPLPNGAYVAFATQQQALADVAAHNVGVIINPQGGYDAVQGWAGASAFTAATPAVAPTPPPTPAVAPAAPAVVAPPAAPVVAPTPPRPVVPPTPVVVAPPAAPVVAPTPVPAAPVAPAVPETPYVPIAGLPLAPDVTSVASGGGNLEAIAIEKLKDGTGFRVAMRYRSLSPNEAPATIILQLMQTAVGNQNLKQFDGVVRLVKPNATVSEGELIIKYADFAAQGLKPTSTLGIYSKWPSGHDRNPGEGNPGTFAAP